MRFRVVCGFEVTIAIFCPTSRFTSVLFPAFGRPTIATNPDLCAAPVLTFSITLMVDSHASRCQTAFEFSLATLSADWPPAPQIEIPANRISLPELELSRSRDSAIPQSWLPFHLPILQSARPAFLPHLQSPCYHASPAKWFLPSPFPVSDACHLLRPRPRFLPPSLPSWRSPRRFHVHQ